jgi:hypothetical protein
MYVPQLNSSNQRQVPVRLSSVNFEGVFTSSRLNMENLISQNLYNNQAPPPPTNPVPPQAPPRPTNTLSMNMNLGLGSKGTPQTGGQKK